MQDVPAAGTDTALWRDHRFRTYWVGQGVSQFGDRISALAYPLIAVTMLHASAGQVGLLTAALWAPSLFALFVGTWVDHRVHKRRLLVVANVEQCLAVALVPCVYAAGGLSMPVLYLSAFALGVGGTLYQCAYPSFFTQLVPQVRYIEANSLLSSTRSASFVVGPALGGALIELVTAPVSMVIDAVSFVVSAIMISIVRVDRVPPREHEGESYWRRLRLGTRYLRHHRYLRVTLACSTTLNFASFVVAAILVLFASRDLHLSAGAIGIAFGIGATGGLLGAAVASRIARRIGVGHAIALGAVLFSAPFAALPLAHGSTFARMAVLSAVEFVTSLGVMVFDINNNSVQTAVTRDAMRSRTTGAFTTVNYGIRPLGALIGGVVATHVGVSVTVVAAAVVGTMSVLWLIASPVLAVRTVGELSAE